MKKLTVLSTMALVLIVTSGAYTITASGQEEGYYNYDYASAVPSALASDDVALRAGRNWAVLARPVANMEAGGAPGMLYTQTGGVYAPVSLVELAADAGPNGVVSAQAAHDNNLELVAVQTAANGVSYVTDARPLANTGDTLRFTGNSKYPVVAMRGNRYIGVELLQPK